MLSAPRMQSRFGSTEAVNVNGTMICPLTTWDSKITTVLAMLGGVGPLVGEGLRKEKDALRSAAKGSVVTSYEVFVDVVNREHQRVFGAGTGFVGHDVSLQLPRVRVPSDQLVDWTNPCGL